MQKHLIHHDGFEFANFDETDDALKIKGDGSTVVTARYNLKKFNATFDLSQDEEEEQFVEGLSKVEINYYGKADDSDKQVNDKDVEQIAYTAKVKVKVTTAEGYKFSKITVTYGEDKQSNLLTMTAMQCLKYLLTM